MKSVLSIFTIISLNLAFGQDSLTQRKHFFKFSSELSKGVEYDTKTNTLNGLTEITSGRCFGFTAEYNKLVYINTFTRFGLGVALNSTIINSGIAHQNPQDDTLNPTPNRYELGNVQSFYAAIDFPLYYQSAMRFRNNHEIALSFGAKLRIIPFINHSREGKEKEVSFEYADENNNYTNNYNVNYGMELSRVIVYFNAGLNYVIPLENNKAISLFTTLNIGGFNNQVNVYYEDFDNSENGVFYDYDGDNILYMRLKMSHLAFGVGYQF